MNSLIKFLLKAALLPMMAAEVMASDVEVPFKENGKDYELITTREMVQAQVTKIVTSKVHDQQSDITHFKYTIFSDISTRTQFKHIYAIKWAFPVEDGIPKKYDISGSEVALDHDAYLKKVSEIDRESVKTIPEKSR